ncbi:MAG: hypothetical protein KZQ62_09170 [Candidatus Thiodiazotropha sp. (ex Lucinoma aequizonata)]|nr:hypothetical protein [Candidatus Thiodiazotropha sp. (ex Lucinoma aequizonata)]
MDYIYDIETYPNCFTLTIQKAEDDQTVWQFEISDWKDDQLIIKILLEYFNELGHRMVGFNNLGFDYPILHFFASKNNINASEIFTKASDIIDSKNIFENTVPHTREVVQQIDLFRIHHFNNRAKSTSLKAMEFNMRSYNIRELPFPPGTTLSKNDVEIVKEYNKHDVAETLKFYNLSKSLIDFRTVLSKRYDRNLLNHDDIKIGKDYMVLRLEDVNHGCCYDPYTHRPKQTLRRVIDLNECIIPSINFKRREFQDIKQWLQEQRVTETSKVFKNLHCYIDDFKFTFGTGGLHGSVEFREYTANAQFEIMDVDVKAYYPSLAIAQKFYPEHLGKMFCEVYQSILDERGNFEPNTLENKIYKLALNGVFGNSNNRYSPFYDPQFTMSITLNGQLLMCLLAEKLMDIDEVEMIQVNTDGLTIRTPRACRDQVIEATQAWEAMTHLTLEHSNYSKLYMKDVNNYLATYEDNKVKRKGAYEYKREWHQNHSAMVVPRAVEAHLIKNIPIREFIENHQDIFDFMLRAKVSRNMKLVLNKAGVKTTLGNIVRYYITTSDKGGVLEKIMPALKKEETIKKRIRSIESGWKIVVCNDISQAILPINFDYYVEKAEDLVLAFH